MITLPTVVDVVPKLVKSESSHYTSSTCVDPPSLLTMADAATTQTAIPMPSAKPIKISSDITLQPPLSRKGRGPGLILVLDQYAHRGKSDKTLDPPPLQKWAEEGYAVAEIRIPGKPTEFPLAQAIEALKKLPECESENGFGLICKIYPLS